MCRRHYALALIAVLVALVLGTTAILGGGASDDFAQSPIEKRGSSDTLVVLLHAMGHSPQDLTDIKTAIRRTFPNADILSPAYFAHALANTSPAQLAAKLDRRLEEAYALSTSSGPAYGKIILVGHSIGALLARRTYLYGKGYRSDHVDAEARQLLPPADAAPHKWVAAVDRIVLLAAMNRGWDTRKIDNRTWTTQIGLQAAVALARATGTGTLGLSLERGAPFISNLRIDWIRMVRHEPASVRPVIQLLGEWDDLVTPGDDLDAITAPNFIFMRLDNTDHNNIIEMSSSEPISRRRGEVFEQAVRDPLESLRVGHPPNRGLLIPNTKVKHIVFIKHGIRDMADWSTPLRAELEKSGEETHVVIEKFPYFSMLSFLLLWDRQAQVRRFIDEYTQALAQFPNATKVSFVGHSFGTYILASSLERYASVVFHRLYFAGSVVRRDFPWGELRLTARYGDIRSDRAASDWVVAIFPRFFEQIRSLPGMRQSNFFDVGSAGFNGFISDDATRYEYHYLKGGHGAALEFTRNSTQPTTIAQFILAPELTPQLRSAVGPMEEELSSDPDWAIRLLGQVAWLVWLTIAAVAALGAYAIFRIKALRRVRGWVLLGYVGVIAIVLNTF
jgi:pimeloyl-ACP methyl ester carboxylesterase